MNYKSDDYTDNKSDGDNIYHGSSAETGAEQLRITPNGEILKETPVDKEIEDELLVPGTESDVTKEDLRMLNTENVHDDGGDDEFLKNRVYPVDFAGEELDVPGTELDDAQEDIGSEDEENNLYSQSDN